MPFNGGSRRRSTPRRTAPGSRASSGGRSGRAPAVRTTELAEVHGVPLTLIRSTARRRTVSAAWRDGRLRILLPAGLAAGEERQWIERMIAKAPAPPAAHDDGPAPDDGSLAARAERLRARLVPEAPRPTSVTWSSRQRQRWGSCTPSRRTLRISTQVHGMPEWVLDAVLVHELAHLLESGHGPAFRRLVSRYDRYAQAMAFLQGVTFATGRGLSPDAVPDATPDQAADTES
ncbi:M48 family metallopeptidase [Micrococcus sp. FDAARGOS_333]|uniref:M48 metallopeptidase family protein n=1 Tax=Micrococcus sp. FDAARGOS_333 TaxID=1930558 RepID=UPI000B4E46C6|nr:M48 family metallopeptidase [Micrococcus sp. FDAARGOS_333]PNL18283.1 M48 family peptidase [Micrococcus sp. FDAARGOS_333]